MYLLNSLPSLLYFLIHLPKSLSQTSLPATITPPPAISTLSPGQQACDLYIDILSICNYSTPGLITFTDFSSEAPCLCYSSSSWAPSIYDGYLGTCISYLSASNPAEYSSVTFAAGGPPVTTPCEKVGDVLAIESSFNATASMTATTSMPTTSTQSAGARVLVSVV